MILDEHKAPTVWSQMWLLFLSYLVLNSKILQLCPKWQLQYCSCNTWHFTLLTTLSEFLWHNAIFGATEVRHALRNRSSHCTNRQSVNFSISSCSRLKKTLPGKTIKSTFNNRRAHLSRGRASFYLCTWLCFSN